MIIMIAIAIAIAIAVDIAQILISFFVTESMLVYTGLESVERYGRE